jgi:hypothetical protein
MKTILIRGNKAKLGFNKIPKVELDLSHIGSILTQDEVRDGKYSIYSDPILRYMFNEGMIQNGSEFILDFKHSEVRARFNVRNWN